MNHLGSIGLPPHKLHASKWRSAMASIQCRLRPTAVASSFASPSSYLPPGKAVSLANDRRLPARLMQSQRDLQTRPMKPAYVDNKTYRSPSRPTKSLSRVSASSTWPRVVPHDGHRSRSFLGISLGLLGPLIFHEAMQTSVGNNRQVKHAHDGSPADATHCNDSGLRGRSRDSIGFGLRPMTFAQSQQRDT